ncbi:T9SS type A sorting domain-containing protein [Luteibaculum oceani]|uniref:T9SS type A sorting domain-containing protein n=1 Tax=Luteibaculum oceani TaxID=1294296 RepID=A0A5C6V1T1_9FLAO|nr:T9SS type A sorting domain-containing protein [Luteibaculum oceani]TXC76955.1 T9SS type A sorting domain-containing protein [Luteibaculum oceani]
MRLQRTNHLLFLLAFLVGFSIITSGQHTLIGVSDFGGEHGLGEIYTYDIETGQAEHVYSADLNIDGRVVSRFVSSTSTDSIIYGLIPGGGTGGAGLVVSYNLLSGETKAVFQIEVIPGMNEQTNEVLAFVDSAIYGVMASTLPSQKGYLFKYHLGNQQFEIIHNFEVKAHRAYNGLNVFRDSLLVGTLYSADGKKPVLYEYNTKNSTFRTLHEFNNDSLLEGSWPSSELSFVGDSLIIGVSIYGGANEAGTLYQYNYLQDEFTKLHDFEMDSGAYPEVAPVYMDQGVLVGCMGYNGPNGFGALYKFHLPTKTFQTVKAYTDLYDEGYYIASRLTRFRNNTILGLVKYGGPFNTGGVFQYNLDDNSCAVIHHYTQNVDGYRPTGIFDFKSYKDSVLGFASNRSTASTDGTLFRMWPGKDTVVIDLFLDHVEKAAYTRGNLVEYKDHWYGTTGGEAKYFKGGLYAINKFTKELEMVKNYTDATGTENAFPQLFLTDNNLIGGEVRDFYDPVSGDLVGALRWYSPETDSLHIIPFTGDIAENVGYRVEGFGMAEGEDGMYYGIVTKTTENWFLHVRLYRFNPFDLTVTLESEEIDSHLGGIMGNIIYHDGKIYGYAFRVIVDAVTRQVLFSYDLKSKETEIIYEYDGSGPRLTNARLIFANNKNLYWISTVSSGEGYVSKLDLQSKEAAVVYEHFAGNNNGEDIIGTAFLSLDSTQLYFPTKPGSPDDNLHRLYRLDLSTEEVVLIDSIGSHPASGLLHHLEFSYLFPNQHTLIASDTIPLIACDSVSLPISNLMVKQSGIYGVRNKRPNLPDSLQLYEVIIQEKPIREDTLLISGCDSVVIPWNGLVFKESGYFNVLKGGGGVCDSIIPIQILVDSLPNYSDTTIVTGCDSVQIPNGNVIFESGLYSVAKPFPNSCDSVHQYQAEVYSSFYGEYISDSLTTCEKSGTYRGVNYNGSGEYNVPLKTVHGCDSIERFKVRYFDPQPELSIKDDTIFLNMENMESYSIESTWFTCDEFGNYDSVFNVQAETYITIDTTVRASYGVMFSINNWPFSCSDTVACVEYNPGTVGFEQEEVDRVFLTPNPVETILNVEGIPEGAKLVLYNALGQKLVVEEQRSEKNAKLDLSKYPSGVYHLWVEKNGARRSFPVVKR